LGAQDHVPGSYGLSDSPRFIVKHRLLAETPARNGCKWEQECNAQTHRMGASASQWAYTQSLMVTGTAASLRGPGDFL